MNDVSLKGCPRVAGYCVLHCSVCGTLHILLFTAVAGPPRHDSQLKFPVQNAALQWRLVAGCSPGTCG